MAVSGTLPFLAQDGDGAELFAFFTFVRLVRQPIMSVRTVSSNGVNQRSILSSWADLWRDVWQDIDAWSGLELKGHTTIEAARSGLITIDNRAGNDFWIARGNSRCSQDRLQMVRRGQVHQTKPSIIARFVFKKSSLMTLRRKSCLQERQSSQRCGSWFASMVR